jgi:hypothetical protein
MFSALLPGRRFIAGGSDSGRNLGMGRMEPDRRQSNLRFMGISRDGIWVILSFFSDNCIRSRQ